MTSYPNWVPWVVAIALMIAMGFMIFEESIVRYEDFCNERYGEGNWTSIVIGYTRFPASPIYKCVSQVNAS